MKAIVEWGRPKAVCKNRPCGVSGQFVVDNPAQAQKLAVQLFHTLTEGGEGYSLGQWDVTKDTPRRVAWSSDHTAWVAVSLLDGAPRGSYAAIADKEYAKRVVPKDPA